MTSYDARVFLPGELLLALGEHTGHFWSSPMLEPIICDAVRAWMKPAPAAPQSPAAPSEAGYQLRGKRSGCAFPAMMNGCSPMSAGQRDKTR